MKVKDLKSQVFTIPNILTYLRILSIPFFMYFTIAKGTYILKSGVFPQGFPLIGLIIMVVAASTDVFDGYIARRFNQTSQLGILMDPLADKLMHTMAALSLVIVGSIHWAFIVLLLLKEALMIVGASVLFKESKLIKANIMGKIASVNLSIAIIMCYFHAFFALKVFYLDWIVLGIGVVLTYVAFFNYIKQTVAFYKIKKAREAEEQQEHKD